MQIMGFVWLAKCSEFISPYSMLARLSPVFVSCPHDPFQGHIDQA